MKKIAKPLMIYEEVFEMMKKRHFGHIESFSRWATEYVLATLKKEEFLSKFAPHIEFGHSDERSIILRDNHLDGKMIEVTLRDNRLWCSEDKPKACMHVFYAMGRPEVANLIDLDGSK